MSVLKILTCVLRTATTQLARTLVVATLAGDWMLMDLLVLVSAVLLYKGVSID